MKQSTSTTNSLSGATDTSSIPLSSPAYSFLRSFRSSLLTIDDTLSIPLTTRTVEALTEAGVQDTTPNRDCSLDCLPMAAIPAPVLGRMPEELLPSLRVPRTFGTKPSSRKTTKSEDENDGHQVASAVAAIDHGESADASSSISVRPYGLGLSPPPNPIRFHYISFLRYLVSQQPNAPAMNWFEVEGSAEKLKVTSTFTYQQLWDRTGQLAYYYHHTLKLKKQDRLLLVFPFSLDFICAFLACMRVGIIAVPCYPPNPTQFARTVPALVKIAEKVGCTTLLTNDLYLRYKRFSLFNGWPKQWDWHSYNSIGAPPTEPICPPMSAAAARASGSSWASVLEAEAQLTHDDIAFLQFTSGSTSNPKAVSIGHGNLFFNCTGMARAMHYTIGDRPMITVCWLPMYHDLGLVCCYLLTLLRGGTVYATSPLTFIGHPLSWIQAMSQFKASFSAAPNFAYELASKRWKELSLKVKSTSTWQNVSLAGMRHINNAGEAVFHKSITNFIECFGPMGLRIETIKPAYGQAEMVVATSYEYSPSLILSRGPPNDPSLRGLVSSGSLFEQCGVCVRIVNPETGLEISEQSCVGEIWTQAYVAARGYWEDEEQTAHIFHNTLAGYEGLWLRSGDLGFMEQDEHGISHLFITGRIKEMIICKGRNIWCSDLEQTITEEVAELRPGCIVVVGRVNEDGNETVAILAELRAYANKPSRSLDDDQFSHLRTLAYNIATLVEERHPGVDVSEVWLLPVKTLPKTTSGKLKRVECKALLVQQNDKGPSAIEDKAVFGMRLPKKTTNTLRDTTSKATPAILNPVPSQSASMPSSSSSTLLLVPGESVVGGEHPVVDSPSNSGSVSVSAASDDEYFVPNSLFTALCQVNIRQGLFDFLFHMISRFTPTPISRNRMMRVASGEEMMEFGSFGLDSVDGARFIIQLRNNFKKACILLNRSIRLEGAAAVVSSTSGPGPTSMGESVDGDDGGDDDLDDAEEASLVEDFDFLFPLTLLFEHTHLAKLVDFLANVWEKARLTRGVEMGSPLWEKISVNHRDHKIVMLIKSSVADDGSNPSNRLVDSALTSAAALRLPSAATTSNHVSVSGSPVPPASTLRIALDSPNPDISTASSSPRSVSGNGYTSSNQLSEDQVQHLREAEQAQQFDSIVSMKTRRMYLRIGQAYNCTRHLIFTAGQCIFLSVLYAIFIFGSMRMVEMLDSVTLALGGGSSSVSPVWLTLCLLPFVSLVFLLGWTILTVVIKWLVLGALQPGVHRMYSLMHFRWWLVQRMNRFAQELYLHSFQGSPVYSFYLMAMGVDLHSTAIVDSMHITDFDLVRIGAKAVISNRAIVHGHTFRHGYLILARVDIGHHAIIAERAVVNIDPCFSVDNNSSSGGTVAAAAELTRFGDKFIPSCSTLFAAQQESVPHAHFQPSPTSFNVPSRCQGLLQAIIHWFTYALLIIAAAYSAFQVGSHVWYFIGLIGFNSDHVLLSSIMTVTPSAFGLCVLFGPQLYLPLLAWICSNTGAGPLHLVDVMSQVKISSLILGGIGLSVTAALSYMAYLLSFACIIVMFKGLMIGRRHAHQSLIPGSSAHSLHLIFSAVLRRLFQQMSVCFGATPIVVMIYRALGANIGERVVFAMTEPLVFPELVRLGNDSFLGDCSLLTQCEVDLQHSHQYDTYIYRLNTVTVGSDSLIGMNSVLYPGTIIPPGCIVGAGTSITPRLQTRLDAQSQSSSGGAGVKTIFGEAIISRTQPYTPTATTRDGKSEDSTTGYSQVREGQLAWLTMVVVAPINLTLMFMSLLPATALMVLVETWYQDTSTLVRLLLHAVIYWLFALVPSLLVITSKWLVVGRMQPGSVSISSWFFFRRVWFVYQLNFLQLCLGQAWSGTMLYNLLLNASGAKLSLSAQIDTLSISEPDLMTIGPQTTVGEFTLLFSHGVENKQLMMQPVRIGHHCSLDSYVVTLFGCTIDDWSHLQSNSVVLKGQALGSPRAKDIPLTLSSPSIPSSLASPHRWNRIGDDHVRITPFSFSPRVRNIDTPHSSPTEANSSPLQVFGFSYSGVPASPQFDTSFATPLLSFPNVSPSPSPPPSLIAPSRRALKTTSTDVNSEKTTSLSKDLPHPSSTSTTATAVPPGPGGIVTSARFLASEMSFTSLTAMLDLSSVHQTQTNSFQTVLDTMYQEDHQRGKYLTSEAMIVKMVEDEHRNWQQHAHNLVNILKQKAMVAQEKMINDTDTDKSSLSSDDDTSFETYLSYLSDVSQLISTIRLTSLSNVDDEVSRMNHEATAAGTSTSWSTTQIPMAVKELEGWMNKLQEAANQEVKLKSSSSLRIFQLSTLAVEAWEGCAAPVTLIHLLLDRVLLEHRFLRFLRPQSSRCVGHAGFNTNSNDVILICIDLFHEFRLLYSSFVAEFSINYPLLLSSTGLFLTTTRIDYSERRVMTYLLTQYIFDFGRYSKRGENAIKRIAAIHGRYNLPIHELRATIIIACASLPSMLERYGPRAFTSIEKEAWWRMHCEAGVIVGIHDLAQLQPTYTVACDWLHQYFTSRRHRYVPTFRQMMEQKTGFAVVFESHFRVSLIAQQLGFLVLSTGGLFPVIDAAYKWPNLSKEHLTAISEAFHYLHSSKSQYVQSSSSSYLPCAWGEELGSLDLVPTYLNSNLVNVNKLGEKERSSRMPHPMLSTVSTGVGGGSGGCPFKGMAEAIRKDQQKLLRDQQQSSTSTTGTVLVNHGYRPYHPIAETVESCLALLPPLATVTMESVAEHVFVPPSKSTTSTTDNTPSTSSINASVVSTTVAPWTVVNGYVYDLSALLASDGAHPGGAAILKQFCGRDASVIFNSSHSIEAKIIATNFIIAKLPSATPETEINDGNEVTKDAEMKLSAIGSSSPLPLTTTQSDDVSPPSDWQVIDSSPSTPAVVTPPVCLSKDSRVIRDTYTADTIHLLDLSTVGISLEVNQPNAPELIHLNPTQLFHSLYQSATARFDTPERTIIRLMEDEHAYWRYQVDAILEIHLKEPQLTDTLSTRIRLIKDVVSRVSPTSQTDIDLEVDRLNSLARSVGQGCWSTRQVPTVVSELHQIATELDRISQVTPDYVSLTTRHLLSMGPHTMNPKAPPMSVSLLELLHARVMTEHRFLRFMRPQSSKAHGHLIGFDGELDHALVVLDLSHEFRFAQQFFSLDCANLNSIPIPVQVIFVSSTRNLNDLPKKRGAQLLLTQMMIDWGRFTKRGHLATHRTNAVHGLYHIPQLAMGSVIVGIAAATLHFLSIYSPREISSIEREAWWKVHREVGQDLGIHGLETVTTWTKALEMRADYSLKHSRVLPQRCVDLIHHYLATVASTDNYLKRSKELQQLYLLIVWHGMMEDAAKGREQLAPKLLDSFREAFVSLHRSDSDYTRSTCSYLPTAEPESLVELGILSAEPKTHLIDLMKIGPLKRGKAFPHPRLSINEDTTRNSPAVCPFSTASSKATSSTPSESSIAKCPFANAFTDIDTQRQQLSIGLSRPTITSTLSTPSTDLTPLNHGLPRFTPLAHSAKECLERLPQLAIVDMEEVARHTWQASQASNLDLTAGAASNSPSSPPPVRIAPWIIIGEYVYDISLMLEGTHPGGVEILQRYAGKDVTQLFHSIHTQDAQITAVNLIVAKLSKEVKQQHAHA